MTNDGDFDYDYLEKKLQESSGRNCMKVGSFSAGSNIVGTLFDTDRLAIMCHKYGSLAIFDYAAVAPYVEINMNGVSRYRPF
jgi:selenocysteine lyase/cysteine desulfurase